MPIPIANITAAQQTQHNAAQDPAPQVRLIAGPGAGKSAAIEERVRWLLQHGVQADEIFAVSFTRASTRELRERIRTHCANNGQPAAAQVQVSTLHSLALRILRAAGLLGRYPADPLVLDDWELEHIFDAEFTATGGTGSKKRREQIRSYHEAFWSTGLYQPANYIPPNPPISNAESAMFLAFHGPRTQTYSCVLPGEIVRLCVDSIAAGNLDPVQLLSIRHLIVDEFQDLNPMDLDFIYALIDRGVTTFIGGDDDQSIYSFRFAMPSGIQNFPNRYPNTGRHTLEECFRCMPEILDAATSLIMAHASPNRIPKNFGSLYRHCAPNARGIVHRWRVADGKTEASTIAQSCRDLIAAGTNPHDILVLLSNRRILGPELVAQLQAVNVPLTAPRAEGFIDSAAGRFVEAALRVVRDIDDYVAHRVILGLRRGVGDQTCSRICDAIIANAVNFRSIFYQALPNGVFDNRCVTAINHARATCATISQWQIADTLAHRVGEITELVAANVSPNESADWLTYAGQLPVDIQLGEIAELMAADGDEQQMLILASVYERLNLPMPAEQILPPRVRLMSMHGAKGLSAKVVFIPGLEEEILPGPWRQPYPGLVLEAARLLYVSISRSRAACILSYANYRVVNGRRTRQTASRFADDLNGPFAQRQGPLTVHEIQLIGAECGHL